MTMHRPSPKSIFLAAIFLFVASPADSVAFAQSLKPAFVPPACQGKPITTVPREEMLARTTTVRKPDPPIDQTGQRKVFNEVVRAIESTYLYPNYNGKDWPALVAEYRKKIDDGLDTAPFYSVMEKFVQGLGDDHSRFESPARVAELLAALKGTNSYVGIGVLFRPMPDKDIATVLAVISGSAAEHNGIKEHDAILAVDGFPVVEKGVAMTERVRGPECSRAVLTLRSPGGQPREVQVIRFKVSAPQPVISRLVPTKDRSRIGYVFFPTFLDLTVPDQVKKALTAFGKLDALIVDNRQNAGGSSNVLLPILGLFTSGKVGDFVGRNSRRPLTVTARPVGNSSSVPLVILNGKDTASYAEVFSGVLQDIGRAKIVGQTTKGNVETLHAYKLPDGSVVWIANEGFEPIRSKINWEKRGILPDVEAYADWDTFSFSNDPGIAAAIKLLGHK